MITRFNICLGQLDFVITRNGAIDASRDNTVSSIIYALYWREDEVAWKYDCEKASFCIHRLIRRRCCLISLSGKTYEIDDIDEPIDTTKEIIWSEIEASKIESI